MKMIDAIIVVSAIVGGLVLGAAAARVVRAVLSGDSRPEPLQKAAKSISGLVFSVVAVAGLIVALGVIDEAALDQLPKDFIALLPKLLVATIIVIGANVLSSVVETAMSPSLARLPTSTQVRVNQMVKSAIIVVAALMAVRQVGIDTTVINLALAAVFFGVAASATMLVGFGGRHVAAEVASTRALKRLISEGDHVYVGSVRGTIVAIHPTSVEVLSDDGVTELVPSSTFVLKTVAVARAEG